MVEDMIDLTRQYHNLLHRREFDSVMRYQANSKDTTLIFDTLNSNRKCDQTTSINSTFIYDFNVLSMQREDENLHYFHDDLGSPIRLINDRGHDNSFSYDEFGELNNEIGLASFENPFTYTGYQFDPISDTLFAQAREYKPEFGSFVSEDLIKGFTLAPFTLNQYTYCWNQPLNLVDLDGLKPIAYDCDGSPTPSSNQRRIPTPQPPSPSPTRPKPVPIADGGSNSNAPRPITSTAYCPYTGIGPASVPISGGDSTGFNCEDADEDGFLDRFWDELPERAVYDALQSLLLAGDDILGRSGRRVHFAFLFRDFVPEYRRLREAGEGYAVSGAVAGSRAGTIYGGAKLGAKICTPIAGFVGTFVCGMAGAWLGEEFFDALINMEDGRIDPPIGGPQNHQIFPDSPEKQMWRAFHNPSSTWI